MIHEASRTALTEWLEEVQDSDEDMVLMLADIWEKKGQLDLSFDPEMIAYPYEREPLNDVYVGFGQLEHWWTQHASELGAKFFVVTKVDHAPYDGVCCFRFPDPIRACQAKILLGLSK